MKESFGQVKVGRHVYYRTQITGADGKRKSIYAKKEKDLRRKVKEFREQEEAKKTSGGKTVAEYAEFQLQMMKKRVSPQTFTGYEAKVRLYILPKIGAKTLDQVKADDIEDILSDATALSSSSYRVIHMLLVRIFSAAKRSHLIANDPTEGAKAKGGKAQNKREALTDDQVAKLLDIVKGLPVETFCRLGLYAGLRREEALALRWEFVYLDAERPYLKVARAWRISHNRPEVSPILKTAAAHREIPIPPQLSEYLIELKKHTKSEYLIHNKKGEPLSGTQWRNLWQQVVRRTVAPRSYTRYIQGKKTVHTITPTCGAKAAHNPEVQYEIDFKVTPHQLRHTYITNLIYANVDVKTCQYMAGHERSKTTLDIYAKVKYNRPADNADAVCAAFRRK